MWIVEMWIVINITKKILEYENYFKTKGNRSYTKC